jgi:hypothetical protein
MTGFVHRLLGRGDPTGMIRPVLPSLYEPPTAASGGLDIFDVMEQITEIGEPAEPVQSTSGPTSPASPAQAPATESPSPPTDPPPGAPPAVQSPVAPPPVGSVPAGRARGSGSRGETARRPPVPAITGADVVAAELGADRLAQPAIGAAESAPSRRAPALAQLPAAVEHSNSLPSGRAAAIAGLQAGVEQSNSPRSRGPSAIARLRGAVEHPTPAVHPPALHPTSYPAFPASRTPVQGPAPTLPAVRSGPPAIPRQGDETTPGEPDVHITIGRIEVRAVPEPPRTTRRDERNPATPTLQDYLRSRDGRG